MEIRGERECRSCGRRWSYYETGEVTCPHCGSMRSVGLDERTLHTARRGDLDLTAARTAATDEDDVERAAELAQETAREYLRGRGFVHAGDLEPLDDQTVRVHELRSVAAEVERRLAVDDAAGAYFLSLLRDDPAATDPADVPEAFREARGLARAAAVDAYVADVRRWLDATPETPDDARSLLERLTTHQSRVEALDGAVDPETGDELVAAANDVASYLREPDSDARERAVAALDELDDGQ